MYNLIKYSENYLQASWSLWLDYWDQPTLDNGDNINDFPVYHDTSLSFKYKKSVI